MINIPNTVSVLHSSSYSVCLPFKIFSTFLRMNKDGNSDCMNVLINDTVPIISDALL